MAETKKEEYAEHADLKHQDPDDMASPEKTDEEILECFRSDLKKQMDDEETARAMMLDDLRFATLDQWDSAIRLARENDPNGARPCLTIDKINQYIGQVTNDMRRNKPGIKVRPTDNDADVETAKVLQGIVRHIEDQSNATVAYETAGDWQVKCGLGYFRVTTDYISNDSFDQEIKIIRIPNTFSTYLGPHTQPDGSDADWGVIVEYVPEEQFKTQYPGKKYADGDFLSDLQIWKPDSTVLVAEYFYTTYEQKVLFFLKDGTTIFSDKYDGDKDQVVEERKSLVKSIKWCKLTGCEILEKKNWAGSYIPIIEVIGKESFVDGKRILWGLVRPAKDNLRMYNYWASSITEKIGLSPKTPYIGAVGQFATMGERWDKANQINYAKLEYDAIDVNGNAVPPPRRGEPAPIEGAMVQMMTMIDRDVQTSLGMFKAAVGESESQQSGKAILALQNESDTGTFHFQDNLNRSIRHCGRVVIDLVPKIMDTKRIQRILGEDGEVDHAMIDPTQKTAVRKIKDVNTGKIKAIYNPGVGKYDTSITVGPSFNTKRMEAAEAMLKITSTNPQELALIGDLMFKAFDWPMADEIAKRHKKMLPPQLQDQEEGQEIPPQVIAKIGEMQQQGQMMQQKLQEIGQENAQLKSGAQIKQQELQVKAQNINAELELKKAVQAEELRLEREKVEATLELNRMVAESKYNLDKQNHDFTMESKRKENMASVENEIMPQLLQGLSQAFAGIGQKLQEQMELQAATLQAQQNILETLQRPKSVSIGGVKKDKDGKIVGATVNTTIQ